MEASGRGILPCPPGAGAEVLGEGEAPGRVGGGSLAAGPSGLAWSPCTIRAGRWAESWAVVAPKL